jgi:hypothetical protein
MKNHAILLFLLSFALISSCTKEEGEGGKGTITGRIYQMDMRPDNSIRAEYYSSEVRVYIIYGSEDGVYHDDMRTDYDGRYQFNWLRPGTYTIFAYSECSAIFDSNCPPSAENVIKQTVTIDKKEIVEIEDIVVLNYN